MRRLWKISKTKWYTKPVYLLVALVIVLSLGIVTVPMAGMVEAATPIYVNGTTGNDAWDGTSLTYQSGTIGPKKTIQAGINVVDTGGTVHVAAGVYKETIDVTKDNLTIQSSSGNPEDTIIDADGANENVVDITDCSGVTISGFTIKGAKGLEGPPWPDFIYGVYMENASDCSLSDSVITDVDTAGTSCSGIRLKNADDNEFDSVTISNISNVKSEPYGGTAFGIFVGGAEDSVILSSNGNSFTSTTISGITTIIGQPVGIEVDYSSGNSFTETSISNLSSTEGRPKGVGIGRSNDNSFTGTTISNLTSVSGGVMGIYISAFLHPASSTNSFFGTRISDLSSDGQPPTGIWITGSLATANSFTDTEISSVSTTETYAAGVMLLWSSSHNTFDSTTISNLAGPTTYGIRLHISDSNSFSGGSISGATCGVRATGSFTLNEIHFTNIFGNTEYGVKNENESASVNATNNWWGDGSGPTHASNPGGTGDAVSDNVGYDPWLGAELTEVESETITGSGTVEDTPTGGDVTIDATGDHTITTAKYKDNPGGTPTFEATGDYYDVHLDNITDVNSLTIEFCPADEDTIIYCWDGTSWSRASNQSYSDGCIVVTITSSTFPSLSDLTGLPFASGIPYPPPPVGGEAYSVNKLAILGPWIALFAAVVVGATILMRYRRTYDRLEEIATAWSFPFTSLRVRMPGDDGRKKTPQGAD